MTMSLLSHIDPFNALSFQGQTKLDAYYPETAMWYDFYTGHSNGLHGNVSSTVDKDSKIGLSVRGGYILPMQKPANNTHFR